MRLDALETEDMLTQRTTNEKRKERGDGDKEGLLLDEKRKQYFTLEYFTAIRINQITVHRLNVHLSMAGCHFSL